MLVFALFGRDWLDLRAQIMHQGPVCALLYRSEVRFSSPLKVLLIFSGVIEEVTWIRFRSSVLMRSKAGMLLS